MTPPTARERARAEFTADLLDAARARVAADGAAGLSLRAVARDLGVASSAVYRYVESRDALLTLLIIEAYDEVGGALEAAVAAADGRGETPAQQWLTVGRAFRAWALEHRYSFELIYGTPVPGYAAPAGTVEHAIRVWAVLVGLLMDASVAGVLRPASPVVDAEPLVTPDAIGFGTALAEATGRTDALAGSSWSPRGALSAFTLFTALLGAVSAELFGHLHGAAADYERVFDVMLASAAHGVGLDVDLTR